jgi:hypothetical protein
MSIFVRPTDAPAPKTKDVITMSRLYAILLAVIALCQLITFTDFLTLLSSFGFPGGHPFAHFLGGFILFSEILAIPFLLKVKMSPLARVISMVFGWLVSIEWLYISLFLFFTINAVTNVGFLGTVVSLVPGWWTILISISFGLLSIWASWGMWPSAKTKK